MKTLPTIRRIRKRSHHLYTPMQPSLLIIIGFLSKDRDWRVLPYTCLENYPIAGMQRLVNFALPGKVNFWTMPIFGMDIKMPMHMFWERSFIGIKPVFRCGSVSSRQFQKPNIWDIG